MRIQRSLLVLLIFLACSVQSTQAAPGTDHPGDIFYSKSFGVQLPRIIIKNSDGTEGSTSVDFAGVAVTEGQEAKYNGAGGKVGIAMTRLFTGKTTFSFLPKSFFDFIGINPDMVIKTLPIAHYFSYIFDVTSWLPIKTTQPKDPTLSIMKVHTGDPACNTNIARMAPTMLMKFKEKPKQKPTDKTEYYFIAPDGTEYMDGSYGMAEVTFHTSITYWGDIIKKIKEWFKKGTGKVIDDVGDKVDSQLQMAMASGRYSSVAEMLASPEGTNVFWEIFKEFKDGVHVNTGSFADLFAILKDLNLSETVVTGLDKEGVRSAGMLYEIGSTLPFPNLELFIKLLQDIISAIAGIPKMKIGWPKNDLRIAIVTRYITEQFFEVKRIIITPREAAEDYYPPYIDDPSLKVLTIDGERPDRRLPIAAYEDTGR